MERRRIATEATLARYRGKAFDWGAGVTCVHLARFHLRNMDHKPPTVPRFRSALAAKKSLKERGWDSVGAMLDSLLVRIPPASMVLGDIAIAPGEGGMDSILICGGLGLLFGWHGSAEQTVFQRLGLDEITGAWRV